METTDVQNRERSTVVKPTERFNRYVPKAQVQAYVQTYHHLETHWKVKPEGGLLRIPTSSGTQKMKREILVLNAKEARHKHHMSQKTTTMKVRFTT